jgi:putative membrane protein
MEIIAKLLVGFIALEHIYILYLEMFAWETKGKKVFKGAMPDELFRPTRSLAANQGLYNGFLSAGLIWSLLITDVTWSRNVALFFLVCVAVAGIYGSLTAARKIFYVQALPALLGLLALLMS